MTKHPSLLCAIAIALSGCTGARSGDDFGASAGLGGAASGGAPGASGAHSSIGTGGASSEIIPNGSISSNGGTTASGGTTSSGGTNAGALELSAAIAPSGCSLTTAYEVWNVRRPDGTAAQAFTCQWSFDDGGSAEACRGEHTFASAGFHAASVVVSEPGGLSGTANTGSVPVWDELRVEIAVKAPACGLFFSFGITKTGGKPSGGQNVVMIEPWQNVTTPLPWLAGATIEVSAAGTYVVSVKREEETDYSLCTASDWTEVTIKDCP